MATIYDVEPEELLEKTAEELKKIEDIKPPEWAIFIKTGAHKERPPIRKDWWYIRAASILRTLYKLGPIGVSKLRKKYGGRKRRGHKPEEFRKAGGSILRKILQQLEKAELAKQAKRDLHKGRIITPKGKSLLDKIATKIKKGEKPVKKEPKEQEIEKTKLKKREKTKEKKETKEEVKEKPKIKPQKFEKKPTAEELVEEVKKQTKKPVSERVPTAAELVARKKNG